jgi:hypothetical protein
VRHGGDVRHKRQLVRAVLVVAQRHVERLAERRVGALDARHDVRNEALAARFERQAGAVDRRDAKRQQLADDGALDVAKRKRRCDVKLALAATRRTTTTSGVGSTCPSTVTCAT